VQPIGDNWAVPLAGAQRNLVGAHLLLLTRLLRRSAKADFAPLQPHSQMERRIVLALHRIEQARVSELATLLGNDLAQVSRALSGLAKHDLVARDYQRDPYRLTPAGAALSLVMDEVAMRRDAELCAGFALPEMFELAGMVFVMQLRAGENLAAEMSGVPASGRVPEPVLGGATPPPPVESAVRAHSAIINLTTTIARTATLVYKRLTGLSSYEWRVLTNVAVRPGIGFLALVSHIGSDKAQVSRALGSLVAGGFLARTKAGRGEPVCFALTDIGEATHDILLEDAMRRNALVLRDLKPGQRDRLQAYLERLIANAARMADRADGGDAPPSAFEPAATA